MTITLTITVNAEVNLVDAHRIADQLRYASQHCAGAGLLTPDDLVLDSWTADTEVTP